MKLGHIIKDIVFCLDLIKLVKERIGIRDNVSKPIGKHVYRLVPCLLQVKDPVDFSTDPEPTFWKNRIWTHDRNRKSCGGRDYFYGTLLKTVVPLSR